MESEVSRDESNLSPYLSARSRLPLCLPEDANVEMALAAESPKVEQQSQKTLVVEVVSLRPIEKFRRAVAKMPRVSASDRFRDGFVYRSRGLSILFSTEPSKAFRICIPARFRLKQ